MAGWIRVESQLKNRQQVMDALSQVAPGIQQRLADVQMDIGNDLATAIQQRAPVRTGKYRASIHAELLDANPEDKRYIFGARTNDPNAVGVYGLYIWRFLEFGTKTGTPAQPHIMPTYRMKKRQMRRRMANVVNRAVRKSLRMR